MKNDILKRHKDYLFPSVANYYKEPLALDHGEGCYLFDADGNKYLDFFGGILTVSVGHCNPKVTSKIKEQVDKLQHTSTLYPTENIGKLAEKLAQITPGKLQKTFFTSSGTEADETAVFMARHFTGNQELIALRHGYSGRSMLAMTLTAHAPWRHGGVQDAGIKHAVNPYCYRCPLGLEYPSCEIKCAQDIEELIMTTTSGQIAGFLAEPIQGVGGFITPPKEYFEVAVPIIKKYGGVFISDEVQTGFGRTGKRMFGIEHYGVEPDMMTAAKGMANGTPIGATIARTDIADSFTGLTISTFGGNPVSMAAALATIEVMEEEKLAQNAYEMGQILRDGLNGLKEKYPAIGDVRGMGLMQALEFVGENKTPDPATVGKLFEEAKKQNVLIGKGGLHGNVVRIAPPLNISKTEIDEFIRVMDAALAKC
ncbi:MAG: aspartate aminotransferase family protein [Calditrichaeota bacterium]|nr:MAG: aspartate aminotransferase family protein [Calditrichota bacterium]MBL1206959.1 aspartate aminotransferase family protein [Calditrichota bacterium]NOG46786.1 aspartate aminotransferase family protein [Calditrichota bacterium]